VAVDRDLVCLILLQNRQRFEAARPSRPRSVKLNSAVVFSHRRRPCSPKVIGGSGELVVGAAGTRSDVHIDRCGGIHEWPAGRPRWRSTGTDKLPAGDAALPE
jgi:hypothetical protein